MNGGVGMSSGLPLFCPDANLSVGRFKVVLHPMAGMLGVENRADALRGMARNGSTKPFDGACASNSAERRFSSLAKTIIFAVLSFATPITCAKHCRHFLRARQRRDFGPQRPVIKRDESLRLIEIYFAFPSVIARKKRFIF
jgi:hypothetical protein